MTAYVVQTAQGTATTANGTVTFTSATTAGNTLIALASLHNATTNASLSNVTLGGVQDNFARVQDTVSGNLPHLYWWMDPLCAGGQTSVVYSTTGGTGAEALTMTVLEVGGLLPIPAGSGAADVSALTAGTGSTWTSTTGGTTSWAPELWVGAVSAGGTRTITGPGVNSTWITLPAQVNGTQSVTQFAYQITPNIGAPTYAGTFAASQGYTAGAVTFPALFTQPSLPTYPAGAGAQQGDLDTLVTQPLGFAQQRVIFRAAQLSTTTTFASGQPGTVSALLFDTVFEDPYQGYNATTSSWIAPFTGWYAVQQTISLGTCATDTVLSRSPFGALIMPAAGGGSIQYFDWIYAPAGGQVTRFGGQIFGATNAATVNNPPSTGEISWVGYAAF